MKSSQEREYPDRATGGRRVEPASRPPSRSAVTTRWFRADHYGLGLSASGQAAIIGSNVFGEVNAHCCAERTIWICNVGSCDLHVTQVDFTAKLPMNSPLDSTRTSSAGFWGDDAGLHLNSHRIHPSTPQSHHNGGCKERQICRYWRGLFWA